MAPLHPLLPSFTEVVSDLGFYASVLSVFAAVVVYRANPLRSLNRYYCFWALAVAEWQAVVMCARTTKRYAFWTVPASPSGAVILFVFFLLADCVAVPHASIMSRVRRNYLAFIAAMVFTLGSGLAYSENVIPRLYPFSFRLACVAMLFLVAWQSYRAQRASNFANPFEIRIVNFSGVQVLALSSIFILLRTPVGSRINSALTLLGMLYTTSLLLSDRVFDVKGAARRSAAWFLSLIAHFTLTSFALWLYVQVAGPLTERPLLGIALVTVIVNYTVFLLSQRVLRALLVSLAGSEHDTARRSALNAVAKAETESRILQQISAIAKAAMKGLPVSAHVLPLRLQDSETMPLLAFLSSQTTGKWLSPELALRQFRGAALEEVLEIFRKAQIGAVVRCHTSADIVFFVDARAGGTTPITADELSLLYDLCSIAASGIERVRAIEQALRSRGLALVGRFAAQMSHQARGQIAAIKTVLEVLNAGGEGQISAKHRRAVLQQADDLATNLTVALSTTNLRPEKLAIAPTSLAEVIAISVESFKGRPVEFTLRIDAHVPPVATDARLLRQALLNLINNGLQASLAAGAQQAAITIRLTSDADTASLDVVDDGPGVPPSILDHLFEYWSTTKTDGTGLGLAYCRETMELLGGSIAYMTPRGQPHAHFRLSLPFHRLTPKAPPQPIAFLQLSPQTANSPGSTA